MVDNEKVPYISSTEPDQESGIHERRRNVPENIIEHSHDADEAMQAFAGHEDEPLELDEATSKRLLRRIDLHLMPVSVTYRT